MSAKNITGLFLLAAAILLIFLCRFLPAKPASSHTTTVLPTPDRPTALVKAGILPDPKLTPGAIYSDITLDEIKQPNFSKTVRDVPESVKRQVFEEYGIDWHKVKPGEYEIDHCIELACSGSNDIHNLWPEKFSGPMGAHAKDWLEKRMLSMVREGKIPLAQAHAELAGDWTKAYEKYIGPFPKN